MILVGVKTNQPQRGQVSGGFYLYNEQPDGDWLSNYARNQFVTNTEAESAGRYHVPLPYGMAAVDYPLSVCTYLGRTYFCGGHTYNLVMDEHFRVWKQGIRGPEAPPAITGAAGSGAIAYTSWYDELTGERSTLSEGLVIGLGTPRTWTIPARPPDDVVEVDGSVTYDGVRLYTASDSASQVYAMRPGDRVAFTNAGPTDSYHMVTNVGVNTGLGTRSDVFYTDNTGTNATSTIKVLPFIRATHQELWLSVAGGLPQLVMRVPVGVTSVVESVAPGDLGESFSGSFERFPRCSLSVIWNDRQILSGDPMNPDTVYLSQLFFPERYDGLYFRTRSGEPVTGMLPLRDYLLVFTKTQTYMLQGYTSSDFTLTLADSTIGSVGHLCNSSIHGVGYIWSNKGPYMFNGSWHPLSPENEFTPPTSWAHRMRAVHDMDWKTYSVTVDYTYFLGGDHPWTDLDDRYVSNGMAPGSGPVGIPKLFTSGDSLMLNFDYTTVQPETGGNFSSARLSIDTFPGEPPWYVVDKWGQGRLFSTYPYAVLYNENATRSFMIHPHYRSGEYNAAVFGGGNNYGLLPTETPLVVSSRPKFVILWGPRYFEYPGVSDIEGKIFTKLWFDFVSKCADRTFNGEPVTDMPVATLSLLTGEDDLLAPLIQHAVGGAPTWSGMDVELPRGISPWGFAQAEKLVNEVRPDQLSGAALGWIIVATDLGGVCSFRGFGGYFVPGPAPRQYAPAGGGQ